MHEYHPSPSYAKTLEVCCPGSDEGAVVNALVSATSDWSVLEISFKNGVLRRPEVEAKRQTIPFS